MKRAAIYSILLVLFLSACGNSQVTFQSTKDSLPMPISTRNITQTPLLLETLEMETLAPVPSFTPLPGPCVTPAPEESNDFIDRSITIKDNGKTFIAHVTSRFWIYLDDRIYPLRDLLNSVPQIIGYVSNGSIRGPQCYPIMFEAVKEGKGFLQIRDFRLSIVVDNNAPESPIPLP